MAGASDPKHLVVGHIAKAHGTRGEVFVWPLTDRPDVFFAPDAELLLGDEEGTVDEEAEMVVVESSRPFKRGFLVAFEGVADRDEAGALARRYLLVPIEWAEPLEEGEAYYHQLLGMAVVTVEGTEVGTVSEVFEAEPADLLEVKAADGKTRLVPFTKAIVRTVDVEGRRLVIEPPPGLLEI